MHIVYAVTTCSDAAYQRLYADFPVKPLYQAQKYHRLMIEGLAAQADVDVAANPPIVPEALKTPVMELPDGVEGGARYHHLRAVRNSKRRLLSVPLDMSRKTFHLCTKDSVVVVDCLNRTAGFAAMLAAKLRGCRTVCIITDLPDMLGGGRLYRKIADWIIRHSSHYVLLTQAMNDYIRNPGKPYVVLEGHADITMARKQPSLARKGNRRIVLYAGQIMRKYGLAELVDGFRMADLPNTQLHIYGDGDYHEELEKIAAEDSRVVYGGVLLSGQVVEKEMDATLLVNPRPTHEEYVKYSFPSKTMEYMSTGTPVLMTELPSLPREYYPHVFLIEQESAEGIAKALRSALSYSDEALFAKGCAARDFVLNERNNVMQAGKILAMLNAEG